MNIMCDVENTTDFTQFIPFLVTMGGFLLSLYIADIISKIVDIVKKRKDNKRK